MSIARANDILDGILESYDAGREDGDPVDIAWVVMQIMKVRDLLRTTPSASAPCEHDAVTNDDKCADCKIQMIEDANGDHVPLVQRASDALRIGERVRVRHGSTAEQDTWGVEGVISKTGVGVGVEVVAENACFGKAWFSKKSLERVEPRVQEASRKPPSVPIDWHDPRTVVAWLREKSERLSTHEPDHDDADFCEDLACELEDLIRAIPKRRTSEASPSIPDKLLHELTKRWDVPMPFADARQALREAYEHGFKAGSLSEKGAK